MPLTLVSALLATPAATPAAAKTKVKPQATPTSVPAAAAGTAKHPSYLGPPVKVGKPTERVTMSFQNADVKDAALTLVQLMGRSVVVDPEVQGKVTLKLDDVPLEQALSMVLKQAGCTVVDDGGVLRIRRLVGL